MEQQKLTDTVEFKSQGGMTFTIIGKATRRDKYEMNSAMAEGTVSKDGKTIETKPGRLYPWLIQRFVVSCDQIPGNGTEVLKILYDQDSDPEEDIIMALGSHILLNVKGLVSTKDDELKKND